MSHSFTGPLSAPVQTTVPGFAFGANTATTSIGFSTGQLPLGISTNTANVKPMSAVTPQSVSAPPPNITVGKPATGGFPITKPQSTTGGLGGGFSFGTPGSSTAANTASTGITLGVPTASTVGGFGSQPSTASGFQLNKPATGGLTLGSFGGTQTTNTAGSALGTAAKPAMGTGFAFGAPGATGTSAPTQLSTTSLTQGGLGGSLAPAATPTNPAVIGLGGVDPQANKDQSASSSKGGASGSGTGDGKSVKEQNMPPEIVQTVEKFKDYVKEQKDISGERIKSHTTSPGSKVKEQVGILKHMLSGVSMSLQRNTQVINKLKSQTNQTLHNCEMAQRTQETPRGSQYENTAPLQYFDNILVEFDQRMILYQNLITDTEDFISSVQTRDQPITPQDLYAVLRRLHETFISLAAQLYTVHEAVKEQKQQFLNYRRIYHRDETDIFEQHRKEEAMKKTAPLPRSREPLGSTPFSGLSSYATMMMMSALQPQQTATNNVFGQQPNTGGLFGQQSTTNPFATTAQGTGTGLFGSTQTGSGFSGFAKPAGGIFGGASNTQTGFGFGSTGTSAFGSGMGQTTAFGNTKPVVGFGSNTTTTASGFGSSFGQPAAKQTGFAFGSAAPSISTTGNLFGSAPATKPTSLFESPSKLNSAQPTATKRGGRSEAVRPKIKLASDSKSQIQSHPT